MAKEDTPAVHANLNTPEAMAERKREEDQMHERFSQQHICNSERVRESMAKNTAALAEKRRRKAIRNTWKREDHCEFNGDKMSERKERMRNDGTTRKPNDSGGQTQKPGPKGKLGGMLNHSILE